MGGWFRLSMAVMLAAALTNWGCDSDSGEKDATVNDPGTTDPGTLDTSTPDIPTGNGCHACLVEGMAFRFSKLDVTQPSEPAGLPEFLNGIWAPDIDAYRLNVILQVKTVTDNGDGTLDLVVTAGSAWHDKTPQEVMPVGGPVDGGATPTEYHFVEGATRDLEIVVDAQCNLATKKPGFLPFHPGPADFGLICTAGDSANQMGVDTIPLSRLEAIGTFAQDCSSVGGASLEGCIRAEAACQICSFMYAPDYAQAERKPIETSPGTHCEAAYCERHCGKMIWANFGLFVESIGVPQNCDADDDGTKDAYQIAGNWEALPVTMAAE